MRLAPFIASILRPLGLVVRPSADDVALRLRLAKAETAAIVTRAYLRAVGELVERHELRAAKAIVETATGEIEEVRS